MAACLEYGSGFLKKFDFIKEKIGELKLDAIFIAECEVRCEFDSGCLSMQGYLITLARTIISRKKAILICIHRNEI